jgi:hypothetical protein
MLKLLQDENFYNTETFHQMLLMGDECKVNKSQLSNNVRGDEFVNERTSLNQVVYVKKKLPKTNSFKKY